jgi:hypothetical protein
MNKSSIEILKQSLSGSCLFIIACIVSIPFCSMGQDSNAVIYNQLYEEIINSVGNEDKADSMISPKPGAREQKPGLSSETTAEIVNERLKTEMEKIIRDAQVRHSDAVKFIQETK